MTKKIAVLLADGFEEGEAIVFIDLMRRLEFNVDVISCRTTTDVDTYYGTHIKADYTLAEKYEESYDAVMMPGGPQGTANLASKMPIVWFLKRHINEGKWICALCSSGAKVLAAHKLLGDTAYSTGDGLAELYKDGVYIDKKVVVDKQFISAKGLGVVFEFSFTVATKLDPSKTERVKEMAEHIYFDHWPIERD